MSKTIRLSEEAHDCLMAHKREDETVSEVVLRLSEKRTLFEFTGMLSDEDADVIRDAIDRRRAHQRENLERFECEQ